MPPKVLCVEDEPDLRTLAQMALETVGSFTVKMCASGDEALQETPRFKPDIILLDVMMPGINGIETLKRLRLLPECTAIPVVFMTAMVQPDDIHKYRNLGAVDVISKPFDAMKLAGKISAILEDLQHGNMTRVNQLRERLEALRGDYVRELPSKMADIKADWRNFKRQPDGQTAYILLRKVHVLSGSGATFNFPAISEAARFLETELRVLSLNKTAVTPESISLLGALVVGLESAVTSSLADDAQIQSYEFNNIKSLKTPSKVLLICDDSADTRQICQQLDHFSIRTEIVEPSASLTPTVSASDPNVILVLGNPATDKSAFYEHIKKLKQGMDHRLSVLMVSADDDIHNRLNAVRLGASAYFVSPVKITEMINYIRSQLQTEEEQPYRVLIVDDDSQQAYYFAFLMEQAGMDTRVVTNPMTIFETLKNFQPELILIDLYMPECSGTELALVIRQYENYNGVSIVFLSMDSDVDRQIQALQSGGDEFIVKSISPERLIAKVETKLKRSRVIQGMMMRDNLTGLLNRSTLEEYLNREIGKVKRLSGVFSYVMLDLDHFKHVNDHYGHQAGDEVLKVLGLLLRQRLRATDIAGRYGGEEFAIVLTDTGALQAKSLLDLIAKKFSELKFHSDQGAFSVTLSAGIAEYPHFHTLNALVEAADQALYQAKKEGRNRVCITQNGQPAGIDKLQQSILNGQPS